MDFTIKLRNVPSRTRARVHIANNKFTKSAKKRHTSTCRKCVCMPQRMGPVEFPIIWTEFRLNNQLCDGIVHCQDGVQLKIHRAIVAAVSPYFKALFTNSINRGQPEATETYVNVPSQTFSKILDYAYTGHCNITIENVEELLQYSDQYEALGVVQYCCQFITEQLNPTNCFGVLRFARHYFCQGLEKRGRNYVRHNFAQILEEGRALETLDYQDIIDILDDDELNVKSETLVFHAIQKWLQANYQERHGYLLDLLKCVRLGMLSYEAISDIIKWEPVANSEPCQNYLNPILDTITNSEDDVCPIENKNLYKPRIPYDIIFAVGGWSAGSPTNFMETYDCRADRWLLSVDTDHVPRAYHGTCTMNGLIYVVGGFDGNEHFNSVRCFDPVTHVWKECACMYYPRCYVSVCNHENKIYAMGGYNGRGRMSSVERYNPETNQWELISSMQKQRSDASSASLNQKIYIVGGFNGQEVMSSGEMYDCLTNQWSFIAPMISARSGVSLISFRNTIYALGGFNGSTRLTTGEKFTPGISTAWENIADMFSPRSNFATVIMNDVIYAIGGFNDPNITGSTTISYVECYDAEKDEWMDASPMNLNRSALSACVIPGLPNAKDYSVAGKCYSEACQGAGAGMYEHLGLD